MRKLLIVFILLFALFIASGQTYEQQSIVHDLERLLPSKPFESTLSKLQIPYWGIIVSVEERGYYYFVEFLVRKAGHFLFFGLLAVACYAILPMKNYRKLVAVICIACIALLDEYRQSFTGGRTQSFQDVALDISGAITFLLLLHLVQWVKKKLRGFPESQ